MRLIDSDILVKAFNETIRDFATEEDKECFRYALEIIRNTPTAKAIPIEWLRKEMVEMIYDNEKVTEEDRFIVSKLINRWEKENDVAN